MVNDCWNPVAVALLVPHWCDDDNPACVDHNLPYNPREPIHFDRLHIYHVYKSRCIPIMKYVLAAYLTDSLGYYWLSMKLDWEVT